MFVSQNSNLFTGRVNIPKDLKVQGDFSPRPKGWGTGTGGFDAGQPETNLGPEADIQKHNKKQLDILRGTGGIGLDQLQPFKHPGQVLDLKG